MNINMLRDSDNDPGFYAAACAADPAAVSWPGCVVYVSSDDGATYTSLARITGASVMGQTTDALADFHGGNVVDECSHVNVRLSNGALSSTTYAGLLAGVNMAVLGDEILYFRDATLQTNGSYTVRGLLRGRRGSEYAMSGHASFERFVLVDPTAFVRVAQSTADIGIDRLYKPVTAGMSLADATAQAFTNLGVGLMPYAPVQLGGGRDASNNATLSWVRRNRISGELRNNVDVPMSEASEAYEVDIFANSSYATVVRTISGLTSPTASYSASAQVSDFGSAQATIYFRVYQLSGIVGKGHAASGSV